MQLTNKTVGLTREQAEALEALAAYRMASVSQLAREAVRDYLAKHAEDVQQVVIAANGDQKEEVPA